MQGHTVVCTWRVEETGGLETAWVALGDRRLAGRGRAVGLVPEPYWVDYELDTDDGYVTRRLAVRVESSAGTRSLELLRSPAGDWHADGRPLPDLVGALDCDLAFCPLTNSMPILRHRLQQQAGTQRLLMAWVSLPDLAVSPSEQRYQHLGRTDDGAEIRFTAGSFVADLTVDHDGLVVRYPQLASRLARLPTSSQGRRA